MGPTLRKTYQRGQARRFWGECILSISTLDIRACTSQKLTLHQGQPQQKIPWPLLRLSLRRRDFAYPSQELRCPSRELPPRHPPKIQNGLRQSLKNQPLPHLREHNRLRPNRAISQASWLRCHGRGRDGSYAHHRFTQRTTCKSRRGGYGFNYRLVHLEFDHGCTLKPSKNRKRAAYRRSPQ